MRLKLPVCAAVTALCIAAPSASALSNCGSLNQPRCAEDPPPGVTLNLTAAENPKNLQPLSTKPSSDKPLWPKVNGHKPYGFSAGWGNMGHTLQGEAYLHQEMGGSMVRLTADWAMIQYYPNSKSGGPSWNYQAYLDSYYKEFIRRGIRPLMMIARTPRRFTINAETSANSWVRGCETSDACWNPARDADAKHISTFVTDLAKRYPLAAGVEFWNEPNRAGFWGWEDPNPERFTSLLARVHDAVKKVRPNWPVVAGGIARADQDETEPSGEKVMSLKNYLKRMLVAGAQPKMDAVSYHPYLGIYPTWTDDPAEQDRVLSISLLQAHKDAAGAYVETGTPILERFVMSEYGASTGMGFSEQKQHDWLVWQFYRWDISDPEVRLSDRTDAAFIHHSVEDNWGYEEARGYGFVKPPEGQSTYTGTYIPKKVFCGYRKYFAPHLGECPASLTISG